MRNVVSYDCLSDDAIHAFEAVFPIPADSEIQRPVKFSESPPALIQLLLSQEAWLKIAGAGLLYWLAQRAGVFVDEFSKGFAGEWGKDEYAKIRGHIRELRQENPGADKALTDLERARLAAVEAEGREVRVYLGASIGVKETLRPNSAPELDPVENQLAFLMLAPVATKSAEELLAIRDVAYPEFSVRLMPFGYRLDWHEKMGDLSMFFDFDGNSISEPLPTPPVKRAELLADFEDSIRDLPNESRESALNLLEAFLAHEARQREASGSPEET